MAILALDCLIVKVFFLDEVQLCDHENGNKEEGKACVYRYTSWGKIPCNLGGVLTVLT